jgi:uncharacterized membrane protein YhhN
MNQTLTKSLIGFYLLVLVPSNLLGHFLHAPELVYVSKPLLLPTLMELFLVSVKGIETKWKNAILGALFFSWVGDVALMFDKTYSFMFMIGLGGFLIAHIHYVFVFLKSSSKGKGIRKQAWFIIPVFVIYTAGLISVLWPHLGELRIPVFVYAIVLMMMGIAAVSRNVKTGFYWVLLGAIMFVISDSILAINKFFNPFAAARVLTMLTYTLAQLFIVLGLSKLIISNK